MKFISKTIRIISCICILFLYSCGGSPDQNAPVQDDNQTEVKSDDPVKETKDKNKSEKSGITAIVGGEEWFSSDDGPHSKIGCVALKNTNMNVMIQAYANDGSYIGINLVSMTGLDVGTYDSSKGALQAQYKSDFKSTDVYMSALGNGTLKIESLSDDRISGSFSFVGKNASKEEVVVENGKFDIPLH